MSVGDWHRGPAYQVRLSKAHYSGDIVGFGPVRWGEARCVDLAHGASVMGTSQGALEQDTLVLVSAPEEDTACLYDWGHKGWCCQVGCHSDNAKP